VALVALALNESVPLVVLAGLGEAVLVLADNTLALAVTALAGALGKAVVTVADDDSARVVGLVGWVGMVRSDGGGDCGRDGGGDGVSDSRGNTADGGCGSGGGGGSVPATLHALNTDVDSQVDKVRNKLATLETNEATTELLLVAGAGDGADVVGNAGSADAVNVLATPAVTE
jgi:hypothetical protein